MVRNLSKSILVFSFFLGSSFASTNIKSLDIFSNKTFVNQKLDKKQKSVDLIGIVKDEGLRFIMDKSCKINSYKIENLNYENDALSKKITELKSKINFEENSKKALESNIVFLQNVKINNPSSNNSILKTSKLLKKEILNSLTKIYKIENTIKSLKESLQDLVQKRKSNKFTRLNYDISCSKNVFVSYPIYNISKNSFYEMNYDSKKKKIELKNLSFITQSSGIDLKGIDINLYTYSFYNLIKPNSFIPEYLDIENEPKLYAKTEMMIHNSVKDSRALAKKATFKYVEDNTKAFFKASNIDLISGKKTKVLFANDLYKAENSLEIDGYSLSQAFYKVDFKSSKEYGMLNAKLYLDGTYIGKNYANIIRKDKKTSIYFGINRFVQVKKELIKDIKEEPFFSLNKLKSTKLYSYKITNKQNKTQKVTLLERVPISKHEDIKVKLIGKTKETKLDKNGKIYYDFVLKPNETKTIEFGYEVEKPNKS